MHRESVYKAAYWVLRDSDEALDAAQDAFLRAYKAVARFEGRSSLRTWLRRIATNVALDRLGKRKREQAHARPLVEGEQVVDRGAEPADAGLLREERRRLVRAAIDGLPPAQRAAVMLRDVQGLSYQEIAAELGIPRGTVMSRIYYGRKNLEQTLRARLGPRADELRRARAAEGSA